MHSNIALGCILTVFLTLLTTGLAITEPGAAVYGAEGAFEVDWVCGR